MIFAFNQGCTPERILEKFPSLNLTDIYTVISYYLRHREVIDAYLVERQKYAEEVRQEIEAIRPTKDLKERLLARRAGGD